MTCFRIAAAIAALIVAATGAAAADKVYGVEISPGGKHYAVLRDVGAQKALAIYSVDDASAKPAGVGLGQNEVMDFEWGGDDHILLRISGDVAGVDTVDGVKTLNYERWLSISRLTGEFRTVFGNEQGSDYFYLITSAGSLVATLPQDSDRALFARSYAAVKPGGPSRLKQGIDELLFSLIEANLKTGDTKRRADGLFNTADWIVSADGTPVARIDQAPNSKTLKIMGADGKGFKQAGTLESDVVESENVKFLGVGSSPRKIQILRTVDGERRLYEYDLDAAAYSAAAPAYGTITEVTYDPRSAKTRVVYVSVDGGVSPYHLDTDDQKTQASLEKAISGAAISLVSKSADGSRMIARADYRAKGSEFYFFDKTAKRLELVAAN